MKRNYFYAVLVMTSLFIIVECKTTSNVPKSEIKDTESPIVNEQGANNTAPTQPVDLVKFEDVTKQFTYSHNYSIEILTAFSRVYETITPEENNEIEKVFHFTAKTDKKPFDGRIEIFMSAGDWMDYPLIYFITDAGQIIPKGDAPCPKQAATEGAFCHLYEPRAYLIPELSTPDTEGGSDKPKIDYQDQKALETFIKEKFLVKNGLVNPEYKPILEENR